MSKRRFVSVWDTGVDIAEANDVAFQGNITLVYADHWGCDSVNTPLSNPTWIDLRIAADRLIRESGDKHHVFIERFTRRGKKVFMLTGS